MAATLLLDTVLWDLTTDSSGNIAIATEPYSVAQDICTAIRTFQGELWYDTTDGVPYFSQILGRSPPIAFMKAQFVAAALTVPDVLTAACYFTAFSNREIRGQVQFTYQPPGSLLPPQDGLITFVGNNGNIVTFVGSNDAFVNFGGF